MSDLEKQIENISFTLNDLRGEYNHERITFCLAELAVFPLIVFNPNSVEHKTESSPKQLEINIRFSGRQAT